jgi:acylpyruvate hydrolase
MQLASVLYNSRPAIVAVRDGQHVLVRESAELGVDSSFSELVTEARSCDVVVGDEDLSWRSVVPNPCRIICLGLNYRAHVEETSRDLPTYPVLFTKWASSLTAAGAPVALPPESNQVDYEGELAVIIGREGRRIAPADALDHVAGLSVANDITMRDYQHRTHQWLQGKAWDASTPLGPYLVTLEGVSDIGHLDLRLELNGQEMQSSNTELLIFDVPTTIARLSEFTTLQPGDVILTGTPGGVGARRDPPVFLTPGDVVRVEIPEVGILENPITSEGAAQAPTDR